MTRLKMKPEHYREMQSALDTLAPTFTEKWGEYQRRELSPKRFMWDALNAVDINGLRSYEWICKELYSYMNDEHIDSALRQYFKGKLS